MVNSSALFFERSQSIFCRLATMASGDGLILKATPRIYVPKTQLKVGDVGENESERLRDLDVK
jgi:hypothetical protein